MKTKLHCLLCSLLLASLFANALPPGTTTKHIKIDQFGYLPASKKVAVIVDPQTGYNAAESFSPGTGVNQYQVRNWSTNAVVYSGTLVAWNGGATHAQSGDRGWRFDFSSVTSTGSYYIYDVANNVGSYRFEINNNVYGEVLKQAARMYFYQRINFAKQPPYTDAKWADGAAFGGPNQDYAARSRYDKTNAATARDVHGGWFDAGDGNKYVTFTLSPLCNLLETYRMHPTYFLDNYNIPESGNGIADILDEVKWEIDWLTRMQDATGTNGLLLKVGADNYNGTSPPSTDNNPRYYVPECTSATLTGAAVFALAATVYKSLGIPSMTNYGNGLLTRAINAWNRAKVTTSNFTSFQTTCDDQNIVSGDADADVESQRDLVVTAAAYLFEATGTAEYRTAFDAQYVNARPYAFWWWGPYFPAVQRALLRYTQMPGATASVSNNIRNVKAGQNGVLSINDYNNNTDLYRSSMPDAQYHWNSHEVKANAGLNNFDFATFGINTAQSALYKEIGESYLHWFHGVNPMGKVMLTNMYAYGGDSCVNEFYHGWFNHGTVWDNVFTSLYGPPPGYVPGGPNKDFSIPAMNPPGGQPPQKSYKEWNTGWNGTVNENSWEITEAGIYTQAAYISLLVRVMATALVGPLPLRSINLTAERNSTGVILQWEVNDATDTRYFEAERSVDGAHFTKAGQLNAAYNITSYSLTDNAMEARSGKVYYRIKAAGIQREIQYSPVVKINAKNEPDGLTVYPNPVLEEFTINSYAGAAGSLELKIFDSSGKLIRSEKWVQPKGNYSRNVPVSNLLPGIYWIQVNDKGKSRQVKIVKQ
ncbi:MAG TPA: glycoside hydrolase family 9 protein [Chitinophagaceae bacterium]